MNRPAAYAPRVPRGGGRLASAAVGLPTGPQPRHVLGNETDAGLQGKPPGSAVMGY